MPRRTFATIPVFAGLAVIVMVVAGILLISGYSALTSEVHNELASQKIYFPASTSKAITALPGADATAMSKYSGQLMTTGAQAETYADHFLPAQIKSIGGGQSYFQLVNQVVKAGHDKSLFIDEAGVFREDAIQSQLLNAFWYSKIAGIMLIGSIVAFAGAALLLILAAFGLARRIMLEADALLKPAPRTAVA
jgi:hypothetical protein